MSSALTQGSYRETGNEVGKFAAKHFMRQIY
jgi:hypothetical protein